MPNSALALSDRVRICSNLAHSLHRTFPTGRSRLRGNRRGSEKSRSWRFHGRRDEIGPPPRLAFPTARRTPRTRCRRFVGRVRHTRAPRERGPKIRPRMGGRRVHGEYDIRSPAYFLCLPAKSARTTSHRTRWTLCIEACRLRRDQRKSSRIEVASCAIRLTSRLETRRPASRPWPRAVTLAQQHVRGCSAARRL